MAWNNTQRQAFAAYAEAEKRRKARNTLAAGGGWTPLSLGSNLLGWWTADDVSTLTLVGSAVSIWRDKRSGLELTQSVSSARPIYSAASFGGYPGLTFDGIDDRMFANSIFGFPFGSSASTLWGLLQQDALAADTTIRLAVAYGGKTANDRRSINRIVDAGVNRARAAAGTGSGSPGVTGSVVDLSSRHVVRGLIGADASQMNVDGSGSGTVSAVPATGTDRFVVGGNTADSGGNYWNGKFRDVVITTPLPTNDAATLEAWLLARRAL